MRARRVKPLNWNLDGTATANGLVYAIFSEHVRGEPRFHWPQVRRTGNDRWRPLSDIAWHVRVPEEIGYSGTLAAAKRWAALHAERVLAALEGGDPAP